MSAISSAYLEQATRDRDEIALAWLIGLLRDRSALHGNGRTHLPAPLFAAVEALAWFAQATRSGVWTYFEATAPALKAAILEYLREQGPDGLADQYETGMRHWRDQDRMAVLDDWMDAHERANTDWLWDLLTRDRRDLERVLGVE